MTASRSFTEEVTRKAHRSNRQREREDFKVQPSARKPATRTVYSDPVPVEKTAPVIRAIDTVRFVGVVDQFHESSGVGFAVVPELDCEVAYFHARDCNFDESMIAPGLTLEFAIEESARPGLDFKGKKWRRVARNIKLAEPITTQVEAVVVRADLSGNAWLECNNQRAYFRAFNLNIGDRVTALVYDAPRGLRATRVERTA